MEENLVTDDLTFKFFKFDKSNQIYTHKAVVRLYKDLLY